jgi:hypothetical protein
MEIFPRQGYPRSVRRRNLCTERHQFLYAH